MEALREQLAAGRQSSGLTAKDNRNDGALCLDPDRLSKALDDVPQVPPPPRLPLLGNETGRSFS